MENAKKYKLQISSGQGPVECELAVQKLADSLCNEFASTIILQSTPGIKAGCCRSIIIESEHDLSFLEGSVKWICQSPYRANHKRKNWFIDVSPVSDFDELTLDETQVRFETYRSGGKGGQHVNKVETGVRATYLPLGISAESTEERSQYANKRIALERLNRLVSEKNNSGKRTVARSNWLEHTRIIRGNAIREYEGMDFRRVR